MAAAAATVVTTPDAGRAADAAFTRSISNATASAAGRAALSPIIPGTIAGFSHYCSPAAG